MTLWPEDRAPAAVTDNAAANRDTAIGTAVIAGAGDFEIGATPEAANPARLALQVLPEISPLR